jgi:hypothetical protein
MEQTRMNADRLDAWLDSLPDCPLTDAEIEAAMARIFDESKPRTLEGIARTLRSAGYTPETVAAWARAMAAQDLQKAENQDQSENQVGSTQNVHIWIAACDHLASLTNEAFADWIEDEVFVQFPTRTPMSDILSEVIDRLRQLPEES